VYYGDNASLLRRVPLAAGPTFSPPLASLALGTAQFHNFAPVLGQRGLLYLAGSDGTLHVLDATTLAEAWRWDAAFGTVALSQLNLDINRDSPAPCANGQPGVLYAVSAGNPARLYAVLVDSQGLERTAPWPRHQHDPANTGNAATSLLPWTCP
jgi:hypothetical protein